jgi:hypothetical protein
MAKDVVLLSPTHPAGEAPADSRHVLRARNHPLLITFSRGTRGNRAASTPAESSGLYGAAHLPQIPWATMGPAGAGASCHFAHPPVFPVQ